MGQSFNVNVQELVGHAKTVATISNQVNAATGSAQAVSGDAYGMIGQFFAQAIMGACGDVAQGIVKVATSVDDVRKGIEAVAKQYSDIDAANANTFAGKL
ncbi:type VII secretion target [Actinokineospora pegani]|uniref:type VII secretion target n=1 Tax=Actinokineospora pegani TaxID=2654637 RepID=UPI0012E99349|nr:type VII secretion target [Actinokineospora pegani]